MKPALYTVTEFSLASEFLKACQDILAENETQNNLILGLSLRLKEDLHAYGEAMPLLCLVRDEWHEIQAAGVMTPPFPLVVFSQPINHQALQALVDYLAASDWQISGVNGVAETSDTFARIWTQKTGERAKPVMNLRAYELRSVEKLNYPSGRMRQAHKDEAQLVADMLNAMGDEVMQGPRRLITAQSHILPIERGNVFFWEDDSKVVSITVANRPQVTSICISGVYTPPDFRKRGYARALVAEVSKEMLARGYKLTNLFTDLSNPTSNKIYQEVGYKPVCDYHQNEFVKE